MHVVHVSFEKHPAKARELALPVQNGAELNNLLPCVTVGQSDMFPSIHEGLLR